MIYYYIINNKQFSEKSPLDAFIYIFISLDDQLLNVRVQLDDLLQLPQALPRYQIVPEIQTLYSLVVHEVQLNLLGSNITELVLTQVKSFNLDRLTELIIESLGPLIVNSIPFDT